MKHVYLYHSLFPLSISHTHTLSLSRTHTHTYTHSQTRQLLIASSLVFPPSRSNVTLLAPSNEVAVCETVCVCDCV